MSAFKAAINSPLCRRILLGSFLCFYIICGLYTELRLITIKPLPAHLLEDFKIYERALSDVLQGHDPYGVLNIGHGYLYPPPALFLIEIFSSIRSLPLQVSLYSTLNIVLLMLMVYGVAKHYSYSTNQVWYWYVICLGFAPFLELLTIGQINVFTLFGIFMLFIWTDRFSILGGAGLALATLTKVSPVLFFGYLLSSKKWRVIAIAIIIIAIITGLSILRYGLNPVLEYPTVFQWLTNQFKLDTNSQSLVAKLAGLQSIVSSLPENFRFQAPFLDYLANNYQFIQRILTYYIFIIIVISNLLFFFGKQEKEPVFIITALGMMLSPNVMWYHHYVFILLPVLIWMGWSRLDWRVVGWCLMGLLIVQIDRWFPPYGLLVHVFGHISILIILFHQLRGFTLSRRLKVRQEIANA